MKRAVKFRYPPGATPLDPNEIDGLIPEIDRQADLNELEKENILRGKRWAEKSRGLRKELLSPTGLLKLHKHMFDEIWSWAGQFRRTEKNIGRPTELIAQEVAVLCDDLRFLIQKNTYPWDELAVRFHHRLVHIHPFSNGNGRHARMAADLLLHYHRQPALGWGQESFKDETSLRKAYISALKKADLGDYEALVRFAVSRGSSHR